MVVAAVLAVPFIFRISISFGVSPASAVEAFEPGIYSSYDRSLAVENATPCPDANGVELLMTPIIDGADTLRCFCLDFFRSKASGGTDDCGGTPTSLTSSSISRFTYVPLMLSASSLGRFLRNRPGDKLVATVDGSAVAIMMPDALLTVLPVKSTEPPLVGIPSIDLRRSMRPRIGLASEPTWASSRSITLFGSVAIPGVTVVAAGPVVNAPLPDGPVPAISD
uniref:Uncharacterized protein n=1 Tax=Anopheles merus TaxID=30066 RepID=A0A182VJ07_ANOME